MYILRDKKQPLEEKLEPATKQQFDLLQKQIDKDPETARMLTSPMGEIPQYYWLYSDIATRNLKGFSLLATLKFLALDGNTTLIFSKTSGGFFTGFILFDDDGREISNIKVASFFDDVKKSNPTLAFDLIKNFFEKEIQYKNKISWLADKKNTHAIAQYDRLLKNKFVYIRDEDKTGKLWVYTVTGKQKG